MKKILALLLALTMVFALAACGRQAATAPAEEPAPAQEETKQILVGMGNSDVPAGQRMSEILVYYGLDEAALANAGCITYGSNVKEVTTQVVEGSVSCGVIYGSDAISAGLTVVDTAKSDMHSPATYPAAVMKNSANPEAAQAFLDYLRSDEATAVFAEVRLAAMSDPLPVAEATETEHVDLYVFAAASMTETLTKIKSMYEALHPNVTLVYNFDSSGTLKTQIEEGAECDLFISAAPKQMNQLDVSKAGTDANPDGLDFVLEGTRINLVGNTVVLAVPEGNPDNITSFDQLAELLKAVQG